MPVREWQMLPGPWRNPVNRVLNLALYLILCFMIGTGWVMWQRLPRGSGHGGGRRGGEAADLLGLTRHDWGDWHLYAGITMLALSALHLLLNWTWLVKIAASKHAWRLWGGLGAGAAIVAFFVLAPMKH
jgi:cytochrome b561